jgi:AcrR family transcriptional regulator
MTMSSAVQAGRRATGKAEKRDRIISAARRVFATRSFEEATTSEIARRAGIATGTLFLYAVDKHELLLMVFNDALDRITEESISAGVEAQSLSDDLSEFFRRRFEFWAKDVELGRLVTADVYASRLPRKDGAEMARARARQQRMLGALEAIITAYAVREGASLCEPATLVARAAHYLYIGELRMWLAAERPKATDGLRKLRALHDLHLRGAIVAPSERSGADQAALRRSS